MTTRRQSSKSPRGSKKTTAAKHSKLGLDIIRGLEELRSHARGEIQLHTRVIEVPDQTVAGPSGDGEMRDGYDFSKGERGKFYHPNARLNIPVYLDEHVQAYLMQKADAKGVTLSELVNDLLKREIEIIKAVTTK